MPRQKADTQPAEGGYLIVLTADKTPLHGNHFKGSLSRMTENVEVYGFQPIYRLDKCVCLRHSGIHSECQVLLGFLPIRKLSALPCHIF